MISSIKNASKHQKNFVNVPRTQFNKQFLMALYDQGHVSNFFVDSKKRNNFVVEFATTGASSDLSNIRIETKASQRKFMSFKQLSKKYNASNFLVVSTSRGIFVSSDVFFYGLGGEILVSKK